MVFLSQVIYPDAIANAVVTGDSDEILGPSDGIALTHAKANSLERLLKFALEHDRSIQCEILLKISCSWKDVTTAVINRLNLPVKDINSFVLADADGDSISPALSSSIMFWQYVLKYKTMIDKCFLVQLTDLQVKKYIRRSVASASRATTAASSLVGHIEDTPARRSLASSVDDGETAVDR